MAFAIPPSPVKAWVNFNGVGTVAIRASKGVSSITDNGTGDYTVNFSQNMVDASYCPQITLRYDGVSAATVAAVGVISNLAAPTVSALRINCVGNLSATLFDVENVNVAIIR